MHALPIPGFEDMLFTSGRSAPELELELRLLLAVKLFELKRVSLGQAATVAGIGKIAFIDEMGKLGIAVIDFDEEQVSEEFRDA